MTFSLGGLGGYGNPRFFYLVGERVQVHGQVLPTWVAVSLRALEAFRVHAHSVCLEAWLFATDLLCSFFSCRQLRCLFTSSRLALIPSFFLLRNFGFYCLLILFDLPLVGATGLGLLNVLWSGVLGVVLLLDYPGLVGVDLEEVLLDLVGAKLVEATFAVALAPHRWLVLKKRYSG